MQKIGKVLNFAIDFGLNFFWECIEFQKRGLCFLVLALFQLHIIRKYFYADL